uniref:Uncharacterized protein n=1 Tax=Avena sativa TaxID=4498 RepID=A0ACD5UDC9_AVESA
MYRNQFRPDRFNEHTNTARRPGRGCASGTHHWVVSGGRGNAAPGARPRSPPNRSVRPGTVQQYRPRSPACVVPQGNTPVENAADTRTEPVNQASLGSLEKQKPPNVPHQSDVLNLDSAKGARAADSSTPTIHSEGHPSTAFTLQFGTLSPGVINTQCDPCSASAPSDITEKKHEKEQQKQEATDNCRTDLIDKYDSVPATASSNSCKVPEPELPQTPVLHSAPPADKVCMDSCKVFPRNPSSPTHQQWQKQDTRKDMISVSQSDTVNKYPAMKPRMSVQIPPPYTPNVAPPPFILPVNGRPLPVTFQQKQPQVPVEFRGPGIQMQPIGSVSGSLPMKMAMPMGNAPHVPPFFVHGAQPGALQQPAFIHQGQGLGCAPPASPHLSQLGNMRITQDLPQQQPRSCDEQKRTVRITHPDTHEELMLNRRGHSYMDAASGQMPLHNMNQLAQPVPTFSPLQKVYYGPNVYNTGHIYLPNASTVPVSNRQMCPKMHPSRHTFDPTINNQAITSISPPVPNPWLDASSRPPTNLRSSSEVSNFKGLLSSDLSAPSQGALKPPTSSLVGKNEFSSQTSIPTCMAETPTSLKFSGEANLKLPAAKSGVHCSTSPHSVLAQQAQSSPALVDHATSVAGPQIINLTQACVAHGTSSVQAKPMVVEESSPAPTVTSSCGAKGQLHHIVPLQSETSLDTEASVGSKNSKYEGNSILGKPPLLYTQEVLSPKFPTTSLFTEDLKDKVNPDPFPEETSGANCSVTSQIQDVMSQDHIVNAEVVCSKSKAEKVDVTIPGAASGSENGTDVSKLLKFPASAESSLSENKRKDGIQYSASFPGITAIVSDSTSPRRKMEHENIDSGVFSDHCPSSATSIVQTKKSVLEATRSKTAHGRRKKRKEIPKADGQKSSGIYSASGEQLGNTVQRCISDNSVVNLFVAPSVFRLVMAYEV